MVFQGLMAAQSTGEVIPFGAVSTPDQNAGADRSSGHAAADGADGSRATLRAALAVGLVSVWLVALFVGWVAWGLTHLLFAAALVAFPWRVALGGADGGAGHVHDRPGR
jgi:hypothetical protein